MALKSKKTKRKKNKPVSPQRRVNYAKLALMKTNSPDIAFSENRDTIPYDAIDHFAEWMLSSPKLCQGVFSNPYPSAKEWGGVRVPKPIKNKSEFAWCCAILIRHSECISEFINHADLFNKAFLLDRYEECSKILDTVERLYGYSLWLVKKKIGLLQVSKGLETQKKYSQSIKDSDGFISDIIPFITHYVSYRSETSISPARFIQAFKSDLKSLHLPSGLNAYLNHHVLSENVNDASNISEILRHEFSSSIIDRYETFIKMVQLVLINHLDDLYKPLLFLCSNLSLKIDDIRVHKLVMELGGEISPRVLPSQADIDLFELLVNEKQEEVFRKAIAALEANPTNIGIIYLMLMYGIPSSLEELVSNEVFVPSYIPPLFSLFSNDSINDEWISLIRMAWTLEGSIFSLMLTALINRECSLSPLAADSCGSYYNIPYMAQLHPVFLLWFDSSKERNEYYSNLVQVDIANNIKTGLEIINTEAPSAPLTDFQLWTSIKNSLLKECYQAVINDSSKLLCSSQVFYRRRAIRSYTYSLLKRNKFKECVVLIVDYYIAEKIKVYLLPVRETFLLLGDSEKQSMSSLLEYVIICYLYVLDFEPHLQHISRDASEDFLMDYNIGRPSQMRAIANQFNKKQLIYFLKEICVEQTMDTWVEFSSSQEVAKERIEICRLIIDLEPDIKDECQAEIRDIIQRLKIKERLRKIDQSKIYVDVESVTRTARQDLTDSYARYSSFLENGMSPEDIEVREQVAKMVATEDVNALLSLEYPQHEMSTLFETMVIHLRNEFVSSNQHGLDGYLSVRIRHNTLAGQLWSPFDNEHLLVFKDSSKNNYKPNSHWIEQLKIELKSDDYKILQNAFIHFTRTYEDLIEEIEHVWIQVRKSNDAVGLIDFRLSNTEICYLSTITTPGKTIDEFLDLIIGHFFSAKLEPSLITIREKLQDEIKVKINNLLTDLQTSCEAISVNTSTLRSSIGRARTNAQITIDRIIEWFRLSIIEKREPFSIDEAISISDASIQTVCPEFKSNYYPPDKIMDFKLEGNLTSFVDLLFIAFDNVVRRSGLADNFSAEIYSEWSDKIVKVRIENRIAKSILTEANMSRVKKTLEEVKRHPYSKSVNQEGGTGFYKMQKILHHDFVPIGKKEKPALDFGFIDEASFFVEFSIPLISLQTLEDTQ